MAFDLSDITKYYDLIAADPQLQKQLWSESINLDARNDNPMKDFIGGEKSGKPIIEKKDLNAGQGQKVTFTTQAPVGGRGVMGAAELKSKTAKLVYGTFGVTVDMRRFAISEDQLVELLRFNQGESRESLLYSLCKQWWASMEADDLQIVLRDKALFAASQPNVFRIGGGADTNAIKLTHTFDTGTIEEGQNQLIGQGAMPLSVQTDDAGSEVPEYMVFGARRFLNPLEDEQKFREAINYTQMGKGKDAFYMNGKYPMWKQNVIARHNIKFDSGNKKQGSPLLPIAFLGAALADGSSTTVTGGGKHNSAGSLTDVDLYDYFSYFGGYYWKTYSTETAPTDSNTYYALIYNVSGANKGKYEVVSYSAANNNGNRLTVTRELDTDGQKTKLTAQGLYSNVHPNGSWIIPCNKWGVPIGRALHMGAEALFMAKGAVDAEEIFWKDDFQNRSGRAHINSSGIQGIRGYAPYEDSIDRYPNYVLVEGALDYGLALKDISLL